MGVKVVRAGSSSAHPDLATHDALGLATDAELAAHAATSAATTHGNLGHANTNDPTASEKAALAGTGTPSVSDKYVSDSDSRMTNARTPTAHASSHTTGSDKIATGAPDGTKFLRDDYAWAAPTATAAAHAANHQADGSDSLYIEMSPDSAVTVPTDYGFVVVGPYNVGGTTLTLQGTSRMVVL